MDLRTLVRSLRSGHCLFLKETFDTSVEFEVEFFKRALRRKTQCLYIGPKKRWEQIVDRLHPGSVLLYDSPGAFYLNNGTLDKKAVCTKWRKKVTDCLRDGFSGLSVVAEIHALGFRIPLADLIAYESEVHEVLAGLPISAVCSYALESLRPTDFEALRLHHGEAVFKVDDGSYCLASTLARDDIALLLQETIKHKASAVRKNREILLINEILKSALLETTKFQNILEARGWEGLMRILASRVATFIGAAAVILCLDIEGEGFVVGSSVGLPKEKEDSIRRFAYNEWATGRATPLFAVSGSKVIHLDHETAVTLLGTDLMGDGSREAVFFRPSFDGSVPRLMIAVFDTGDLLVPPPNLVSQELLDTLFSCFAAAVQAQREYSRYAVRKALEVKLRVVSLVNRSIRHEINNLLQVISGNAQLLMLRSPEGTYAGERARKILSAAKDASAVTDRLRQLAADGDVRNLVPVNLCEAAREAASIYESNGGSKVRQGGGRRARRISLEMDATANPVVMADRIELEAAIVSLTIGVAEGIPEGGNIIIAVKEGTDGTANLTVRGDGPGIPAEELERRLDSFITTAAGHSGLGLGITRQIVSDYGGEMEISNEPGGGPLATIRLPVLRA